MHGGGYLGLTLSVMPYGSRFWVWTAVSDYGGSEHLGEALCGHHVALTVACHSEVEQEEGIYLQHVCTYYRVNQAGSYLQTSVHVRYIQTYVRIRKYVCYSYVALLSNTDQK